MWSRRRVMSRLIAADPTSAVFSSTAVSLSTRCKHLAEEGRPSDHFDDPHAKRSLPLRKSQPSRVEVLAATRWIEGRSIERYDDALVADIDPRHGCFEIKK